MKYLVLFSAVLLLFLVTIGVGYAYAIENTNLRNAIIWIASGNMVFAIMVTLEVLTRPRFDFDMTEGELDILKGVLKLSAGIRDGSAAIPSPNQESREGNGFVADHANSLTDQEYAQLNESIFRDDDEVLGVETNLPEWLNLDDDDEPLDIEEGEEYLDLLRDFEDISVVPPELRDDDSPGDTDESLDEGNLNQPDWLN